MEKYDVLKQVGEGSFGQVYKAKKRSDGEIVAFKVIRKRGRSQKELKSLRQECEIQRLLHHPNIVQMLDAFETENELVVVTEYADKELYEIIGKAGRLSEDRAQVIACDLVSALYYLHSNRVLHRDLKPQNVLLEANGVAKLCDFGFARSMSIGTHVLTSIKGTPLYMAPELIEECPYDHNADLWSLGCIVYELLVGSPPFQTTSILHLVRLIRFEAIKWPEYISQDCQSFLQGLLQKDPSQRLTWPALLEHPFVKNRIIIVDAGVATPFTTPLSASQAKAKQQQLQNLAMQTINHSKKKILEKTVHRFQEQERKLREYHRTCISQPRYPIFHRYCHYGVNYANLRYSEPPSGTESSGSVDVLLGNLSLRASLKSDLLAVDNALCQNDCPNAERHQKNYYTCDDSKKQKRIYETKSAENEEKRKENSEVVDLKKSQDSYLNQENLGDHESLIYSKRAKHPDWNLSSVERPIENEEWLAFLQRSMEEVMEGEIGSLEQENFVSVFVSPLRNPAADCRVVEYVTCLLSLPLVIPAAKENLEKIERVYLDVRVVPNLVYAVKLLMSERVENELSNNAKSINSGVRQASTLSADELQALQCVTLLLCRVIHNDEQFLTQFCDAIYIVNGIPFLQQLLTLEKRKARIVSDLLAILNCILRSHPENAELVERIVFSNTIGLVEHLGKFLTHRIATIRARACCLVRLLGRFSCRALQQIWGPILKKYIEELKLDENENVRMIARDAIGELKQLSYYNQQGSVC